MLPRTVCRSLVFACTIACLAVFGSRSALLAQETAGLTFEKDIRPILRAHCLDCHGATSEREGQLDLRQVRLMLVGGDSGAALVPGDVEASLLLERIRLGEMPPGKTKLTAAELEKLEQWVAAGAPTLRPETETLGEGIGLLPEDREWWAFQPLEKPAVPMADDPRVRNEIDRFVLAKLQERGLTWSDEADRRTLAIRLSIDLTGLPPSYEQLESMLADESPGSYERWVDQLLESPGYGERWARHWLDIVGYADSEGFTPADLERSWAFHYRDWVIRAIQSDLPVDQFIQQQLAGDELFTGSLDEPDLESWGPLIATGFLRMAADGTGQSGIDETAARQQTVADTLKIISSSMLGMTVACAQCHDHRYDPILQEDYYRLRAVFAPALDPEQWVVPAGLHVSLWTSADREAAAAIEAEAQAVAAERAEKEREYLAAASEKELAKFDEPLRSELSAAFRTSAAERSEAQNALLAQHPSVNISPGVLYQYDQAAADRLKEYDAKIAAVRAKKPAERYVRVVREAAGHQPETFVFHRGDPRQPTKSVMPGDLSILFPIGSREDLASDDPALSTTGRRLAFARHLTAGRHPLFNRVFVNRIWMHHFGRGIVPTPGDLGRLGEPASHPELLDWLACELADGGWSLKRLHRLIVTSHTYRQSSLSDDQRAAIDAEAVWLWRFPLRRLEAEALRDRVLQVSGSLESTPFGPPVPLMEDETGQVTPQSETRRSIYLQVRRSKPVAFLQAFDQPVMETHCERRDVSTVAPQALMLLNSNFMGAQAKQLADRCAAVALQPIGGLGPEQQAIAFPEPIHPWEYGYAPITSDGGVDLAAFAVLPHRAGGSWQGGPSLPDAMLDWCLLTADGGHPGNGFAVVRRFRAPYDGLWKLSGSASHGSENGDGVRLRWMLGDGRALGEWVAHHGDVSMAPVEVELRAGDTIDWVVDARDSVNSDTFVWRGEVVGRAVGSDREERFSTTNPPADGTRPPLAQRVVAAWRLALLRDPTIEQFSAASRWMEETAAIDTQAAGRAEALEEAFVVFCRALLGSNEFLYVD